MLSAKLFKSLIRLMLECQFINPVSMESPMAIRPRRSVLYMPASNQRALEKARGLAADTLILDLEDSVAPEAKTLARQQVVDAIAEGGYGQRELVVRVNGLDTEWGEEDLKVIAHSGADAICLSKLESAAEIEEAIRILDRADAPADLGLWLMAETAHGILNINELATATARTTVIMMGTSDLAKELRLRHSADRLGMIHALSQCVMAARANNLDIIDGVFIDLNDEAGFRDHCDQGAALGFDGKSVIHPKQLAIANEVFSPSDAELERAGTVFSAWQEAEAQGQGVVLVDGKLVERLHVEEALRHHQIAQCIAELENGK
jgi:citrate lyase subunit beta/citryl-CoA lyase